MSVNKAEFQWEAKKEKDNRKRKNPTQNFIYGSQAKISTFFAHGYKFSLLLGAVEANVPCAPVTNQYSSN